MPNLIIYNNLLSGNINITVNGSSYGYEDVNGVITIPSNTIVGKTVSINVLGSESIYRIYDEKTNAFVTDLQLTFNDINTLSDRKIVVDSFLNAIQKAALSAISTPVTSFINRLKSGENAQPSAPLDIPEVTPVVSGFDVCIVGGGAGGIGAAYALKNTGLKVCIVDMAGMLGGTHTAGYLIDMIPSPAPPFLETIYNELSAQGTMKCNVSFIASCSYRPSNKATKTGHAVWTDKNITNDPDALSAKYAADLAHLTIKLNSRFVSAQAVDGVCQSISVENVNTGVQEQISAKFFIDSSGEGILCRAINIVEDEDWFIGSDPKTLYNEPHARYKSRYDINVVQEAYCIEPDPNGTESDTLKADYQAAGVWKNSKGNRYFQKGVDTKLYASPSTTTDLTPADLIDKGTYSTLQKGKEMADYHWAATKDMTVITALGVNYNPKDYKMRSKAQVLGIREAHRIACEYMLVEGDICNLVRPSNIYDYIAASSWWADFHAANSITDEGNIKWDRCGIPYGCLIPKKLKNVLIGSKGFGCSHIAAASVRLTKTMMSIGYAAGKAMYIARAFDLDDVREVDIPTLQHEVGLKDMLERIDNFEGL